MSASFIAQNDLERQLIAAQNGELPPEQLLMTLLNSEVFMPVYEPQQIGGLQTTTSTAQPLKLTTETGDAVLVLFSSPERAKVFVADFPGYGGGLVTEFRWILEKLGVGYAITLNPSLEVGMDFEAQDVAQLAALSAE
ncbi:SseB family protein [Chromatium okenii]|uniref:SseB family protein n=1 Tax=Chromatium okenii TaxID=61644 RepID=UPI0026F2263D|nr:SseB family protein [Chromatium okenii]MBV5309412.1 SseB family protein [Chromatium okenii]